jgi:hypothetical protein
MGAWTNVIRFVGVQKDTSLFIVVIVGRLTTLKLVFRRWLQKFQHHKPTYVAKDR